MGKNSQSGSNEKKKPRAFVLKVAMHCKCTGCLDKIRKGVKELALAEGVEHVEPLTEKGEVKVVAKTDPEKLRRRLHKATNKNVDLVFPKEPAAAAAADNHPTRNAASQGGAATNLASTYVPSYQDAGVNQGGWNYGLGAAVLPPQGAARPYPWAVPETYSYPWGYPQGTYSTWPPRAIDQELTSSCDSI